MDAPLISLLFMLGFVGLGVLYTLTLQNTLNVISPANRQMNPGMVWLIFIPIFNFIWQFVIVYKLSNSINKELITRQEEAKVFRPTFGVGFIASVSWAAIFILNLLMKNAVGSIMGGLFGLIAMISFIIYWAKVAHYKRKIKALQLTTPS